MLGTAKNIASSAKIGVKNIANYVSAEESNNNDEYYKETKNRYNLSAYMKNNDSILGYNNNVDYGKMNIEKSIAQDKENIEQETNKMPNGATKFLAGTVAPIIGEAAPSIALTAINPIAGAGYTYASSAGNNLINAKEKEMNDKQALMYSRILGAKDAVENLALMGMNTNVLKSTKLSGQLLNVGKNALGMGAIGATDAPIEEATAGIISGKADWNNIGQRMLKDGVSSALTSSILGLAQVGSNAFGNLANKIIKGQNLTVQDYNTAIDNGKIEACKGLGLGNNATENDINKAYKQKSIEISNKYGQTSSEYNTYQSQLNNWKNVLLNNEKIEKINTMAVDSSTEQKNIANNDKLFYNVNNGEDNINGDEGQYAKVDIVPVKNNKGEIEQDIKIPTNQNQNIENNNNMLYNNFEKEGDISGQGTEKTRNTGLLGQYGTSIQQNSMQQEERQYNKSEYQQWGQINQVSWSRKYYQQTIKNKI